MKFKKEPVIGRGFLVQDRRPHKITAPGYRGRLKLPRDYKKGHILSIVAWVRKTEWGPFISIEINTQKIIRQHIQAAIEQGKKDRAFQKMTALERAEHEAGLWPKKPPPRPPRPPMAPKEIRRKDII